MLNEPCQLKRQKERLFQSLFLSNDKSQEVKVIEDEQIDFGKVQKHLDNGGSVFITSKNSQKLQLVTSVRSKSRKLKRKERN
jgi:hypothetical protein